MDDLLFAVNLTDGSDSFELAAEMLAALELDFSSWEDRENKRVIHSIYFLTASERAEALPRIKQLIADWTPLGVCISDISTVDIRKEDWAEAWKKYFSIIPISDRLVIKPSWLEYNPLPGQQICEIDPGMSFGTGQHATTLFCLKMIDKLAVNPEIHSFLDAGCGSGILAIAAAKLSYSPINAFDYDADAVMIAGENFEINHITAVKPEVADAAIYAGIPEKYDFVCANILGHLLKAYRHNIANWIRPGGYLALAGILDREFDSLSEAFVKIGFEEVERESLREWTSGLFRKKE